MDKNLELCPNPVVLAIGKPADEFTKKDIIKYIEENGIKMVNFMYPAGDGRLKTLNFVINSILSGTDTDMRRACRRLKPFPVHRGKQFGFVCHPTFPHRIP